MLSQAIWWSSIALEILLLVRGFLGKLAHRYPVFYAYLAFVLFEDLSSLVISFQHDPNGQAYAYWYWITEFIGLAIGCGIVLEIYRKGLSRFPGTARMARNVLVFVFVLALAKALMVAAYDPQWLSDTSRQNVEQPLRVVQAVVLAALVALFLFYSIPFRRNLRGIVLGYGLFLGAKVVILTMMSTVDRDVWWYANSAVYPIVLCVWLGYLWSYREAPSSQTASPQLEVDYQRAAAATRRRLQTARGQLAKVVRS